MNIKDRTIGLSASAAVFWLTQAALAQTPKATASPANPVLSAAPPAAPTATSVPAPAPPPPAAPPPAAPPAAAPPPAAETAAPNAAAPAAPVAAAPAPIALPPVQPTPAISLSPGAEEGASRAPETREKGSALKSSPFMDATLNGTWLEDRFGDPFVFGVQGGAYLGGMVRLAIRLEMPTNNARDDYSDYDYAPVGTGGNGQTFTSSFPRNSEPPTLLYGGSLGLVATSSENFVFAPGLVFVRSDVSDYGSMLGIAMPFEWVTSRGMRFGLELDLGRAFGGKVHLQSCTTTGVSQVCDESTMDRPAGRAFALRFQMGFGFNRPR